MAFSYEIKDAILEKNVLGEKKKIIVVETIENVKEISVDELIRKVEEVNSGIERLQGRKLKLVQEINEIVDQTGIKLFKESQAALSIISS